jgi:hypothetical protein
MLVFFLLKKKDARVFLMQMPPCYLQAAKQSSFSLLMSYF